MFKFKYRFPTLCFIILLGCSDPIQEISTISLIPYPNLLTKQEGYFLLNSKTKVFNDTETTIEISGILMEQIDHQFNSKLKHTDTREENTIAFEIDSEMGDQEGYELKIDFDNIVVKAGSAQGLFYGYVTLTQILARQSSMPIKIPAMHIKDSPRFDWRGLHLDVSRHFFPVSTIKRLVDFMAYHKLNTFHWHLVDGIGWRIQINSRPKLTEIGAWRKVKKGKKPWQEFEVWRHGDSEEKYGGFYTQEEIKEVVKYAAAKFITIVPEIELPGHSRVVFYCYPELLCEDDNGKKMTGSDVYCAANSGSYELLEDVLDEVLELFPSEYIHIGGDEVDKTNWKNCRHCKKMMAERNYSPEELQSHFVNHFDTYLKSKGRKLIGWHEILEGELSESSTIMYWGGEKGVENNLKKGHPTVLTTGNILYFDHYQSLSQFEPKAFGGFSSLSKVYQYNPVPDSLNAELKNLVMGVQANTWTEYMHNQDILDYRIFPRLGALSEIAWTQDSEKDWPRFGKNMLDMLKTYDSAGINYAKSAFRPAFEIDLDHQSKNVNFSITTELPSKIYYTLDGTEPNSRTGKLYESTFSISEDFTIKAVSIIDNVKMTEVETHQLQLHKARGMDVDLLSKTYGRYHANGGKSLVDLQFGGSKWGNGKWLGVLNNDFEAIVKMDKLTKVSEVTLNCIEETGAGIHFPTQFQVWVSSDGQNYQNMGITKNPNIASSDYNTETTTQDFGVKFEEIDVLFIKVKADVREIKGRGIFIFADELIVN